MEKSEQDRYRVKSLEYKEWHKCYVNMPFRATRTKIIIFNIEVYGKIRTNINYHTSDADRKLKH